MRKIHNLVKPPIKLYWWKLSYENKAPGNFGDELTKEIIRAAYDRRVIWAPIDSCEIIGAGSIIEQVTEAKGDNRPYLWGSGFIEEGQLTINEDDYKIIGVRGRESLKRVTGEKSDIILGDPGLLADCLIKRSPRKKYRLGIIPHYMDTDNKTINQLAAINKSIKIIDATKPCKEVVKEISMCEATLSSSLHGLIVSDSFSIPNLHIKLSNLLKGGDYKFKDYYSVFENSDYESITPNEIANKSLDDIIGMINKLYTEKPDLDIIKKRLLSSFPYK